jgi:hypothetical protein
MRADISSHCTTHTLCWAHQPMIENMDLSLLATLLVALPPQHTCEAAGGDIRMEVPTARLRKVNHTLLVLGLEQVTFKLALWSLRWITSHESWLISRNIPWSRWKQLVEHLEVVYFLCSSAKVLS